MNRFVGQQIAKLLGRLAFEIHAGTKSVDPERVHRLRVATRRISTALRVFEEFVPRKAARKVRRQLRELMQAAALLRDRDIAIGLLGDCGVAGEDPLLASLAAERAAAEVHMITLLKALEHSGYSAKWRERLELP